MRLHNNWYVITGAPSSGKTTIVKLLEAKGFDVVYEAARIYIDQEMKKGKSLKQIRKNELLFQKKVLKLKIECEKKLPKEKIIFFDRGIPDSEAYYRMYRKENDVFLRKAVINCSYKKTFLFEMIGHKPDYARVENRKQQAQINDFLIEVYKKIGVPLVVVPKMPIGKRLDYVLQNL